MKIIYKDRGEGKTTDLIKLSAERGGYIVCRNIDEASNIAYMANVLKLNIPHPITYDEFINKRYGEIKEFYIDNVENLLLYMSRTPIHTITLTKEEEVDYITPSLNEGKILRDEGGITKIEWIK